MKLKKTEKSEWISTFGGLLLVIGIICTTLETNNYLIFGFLITGIVVTGYGIIASAKVKKGEKETEEID